MTEAEIKMSQNNGSAVPKSSTNGTCSNEKKRSRNFKYEDHIPEQNPLSSNATTYPRPAFKDSGVTRLSEPRHGSPPHNRMRIISERREISSQKVGNGGNLVSCTTSDANKKGSSTSLSTVANGRKSASRVGTRSIPECIIQVPPDAKAGSCILVTWPEPNKCSSIVEIPDNFKWDEKLDTPIYIRVVAPCVKTPTLKRKQSKRKSPAPPPISKVFPRKCSRVGESYQATQIPDYSEWQNVKTREGNQLYDAMWDPAKAEAVDNKNCIYDVLKNIPTNKKELMMKSLHKSDYNTKTAWKLFLQDVMQLTAEGKMHGDPLYENEINIIGKAVWDNRKNFREVLSKLRKEGSKISLCTLLVHYYRNIKASPEYSQLKKAMENETDECHVCGDGGVLICCDHCGQAYHMKCLKPPLNAVPEGMWFCPKCEQNGKGQNIKSMNGNEAL